jgi:hypothetical protein
MEKENSTTQSPEITNSITLSRGQKGTYAWEIKLRWPMGAAVDQTLEDMSSIDDRLRATYPTAGEG